MNNSNSNFYVPTLTLSNYRSKKNSGISAPTHDYTQKTSIFMNNYQQNSEANHNNESALTHNVYKKP